jgi:hypothetical protein
MSENKTLSRAEPSTHTVGAIVGEFMAERQKERQEELVRQAAAARRRNPLVLPFLIALCLTASAAPSLLPPLEEPLPPAIVEQGARLNLYLASLRVRKYRATEGRLPMTLFDAGVDSAGISYTRQDSSFELSTHVLGARMVYRSALPDSVFLGDLRVPRSGG